MIQSVINFVSTYFLQICLLGGPVVYYVLNKHFLVADPTASTPETTTSSTSIEKPAAKEADAGIKPSNLFGSDSNATKKVLPTPLNTPYSPEKLAEHDGANKDLPVFLAVKGKIFDVSSNRVTYSPGGGYHMFAGKDASRALGISSLKKVDCTDDLSGMTEQQMKVLEDWYKFFEARYPIIGVVQK